MKTTNLIAAFAVLIPVATLSAQEAPTAPAETAAPAPPSDEASEEVEEEAKTEQKICRRIREEVTGSRTRSRKVCATPAQWEQYERQQQR